MARFTLPRDLYHGKGSLEALKSFTGKKAMICVGGGSMKRFGFLDRAVSYLKEAGMEVELFEGIEPDPSVETVMRGADAMLKFEPDWIIAMGGGSPIDAAKAMWIKYEYPDITFEDMCKDVSPGGCSGNYRRYTPMARFTLPRDLYHGKGSLEALKSFTGKKAMICVGGGSMKRFGFLDRAVSYLKEAGMEVELFEGIEPDPSVETVMRGADAMLKFEPDWIIAMGGGSPIDAAKAMWIKYEYPDITFEDMCKVFGIPPLRRKAHFCAISSTSGTATEVTAFSIITDYQKGIKYPIADFEITPDVAIVDPDLAETMPQKLVAHTGMDAMTHAIEAYVSTAHCDYTDPLAVFAIRMIQSDLVDSYNGDMSKRDAMHNAQCLAGMAFSNALLGIVHSMAHKTGAAFADYGAHIVHGAANAMYLPKVIAFNAKDPEAKKRYGVIADEMKLGGTNDDEKVRLLIDYLRGMNDALNIPHCIGHYGPDSYPAEQGFVPEEVFLERLPEIAKNAIADACTGSNPRQPSQEEMEKLLKCCYYDTEVDF